MLARCVTTITCEFLAISLSFVPTKNPTPDPIKPTKVNFHALFPKNENTKPINLHVSQTNTVNTLGFNAEFVSNISLPIQNVKGAIKFPNQAQFHPRKYLQALCNIIKKNNGQIFEDSCVLDIKKEDKKYITYSNNNKVISKYVILATRYPIINFPGFYLVNIYSKY